MNTDYLKKCAAKLLTEKQMSEAFLNNMFLALSGGLQDAYTYNVRDHVFSNAQTGNVVLMSQHIISGDMRSALRYLVPLVSFVLGVYISEEIHLHFKDARKLHWRQSILLLEIIILTLVGFLPGGAEYAGYCAGFLCLRDAGAVLPQGGRLFLRQYHVYRQLKKRNHSVDHVF